MQLKGLLIMFGKKIITARFTSLAMLMVSACQIEINGLTLTTDRQFDDQEAESTNTGESSFPSTGDSDLPGDVTGVSAGEEEEKAEEEENDTVASPTSSSSDGSSTTTPPADPELETASTDESSQESDSSDSMDSDSGSDEPFLSFPLVVEVQTKPVGGRYAPDNIGAIWVESAEGDYIRSLEVWARVRKRHLVSWVGVSSNEVGDAITSATLLAHDLHRVSWDGRNSQNEWALPGHYVIKVEVTDRNSGDSDEVVGPVQTIPISIDGAAISLKLPDTRYFTNMHVYTDLGDRQVDGVVVEQMNYEQAMHPPAGSP